MKVVINREIGGFSVSNRVLYILYKNYKELLNKCTFEDWFWVPDASGILPIERFKEERRHKYHKKFEKGIYGTPNDLALVDLKNQLVYTLNDNESLRSDVRFISTIEALGEQALPRYAKSLKCLSIIEIPDNTEYIICESDSGIEWVAEKHRTWYE